MKKLPLFLLILLSINLYANKEYRIALGAFSYKNNALKMQKRAKLNTYIIKNRGYHILYAGKFSNMQKAKKLLKKVKKTNKDAYIVSATVEKIPPGIFTSTPAKKIEIIKPKPIKKIIKKVDDLQIGKTHYQNGEYEQAMMSFDRILINEPNNHQARLEYARTLYMLGFYNNSKEEFQIVLNTNPPKTVQKNINFYLKKINDMSKKHYFYGSIGAGLSYDDNLDFKTHHKTTTYGGLELQNNTVNTKGFFANLNLSLVHNYISDSFGWSNRFYSYNEFQNEDIENLNFLNFTTTPSKEYGKLKISLPIGISHAYLNGSLYNLGFLLNPTFSWQIGKSNILALLLKYQDTKISKDKNRDYGTLGARISLMKTFDKLTLTANSSFEKDERKVGERFDVSRDKILLGTALYYELFKNSEIHLGYQYSDAKYRHIDPALGYKREDNKNSLTAGLKQKLTTSSLISLNFLGSINDSNINTYSYKKNSYTLLYKYGF